MAETLKIGTLVQVPFVNPGAVYEILSVRYDESIDCDVYTVRRAVADQDWPEHRFEVEDGLLTPAKLAEC